MFARGFTAFAITAVVTAAIAAAPAAHADGLGGIASWTPITQTPCGGQNQIPILVFNGSDSVQTGSVNVPSGTAANVQLFQTQQDMESGATSCTRAQDFTASGYLYTFTVQPGETAIFWAALGGVDYNMLDTSHNIGVGGLPTQVAGQDSWFDFNITLGLSEGFQQLQVQYDGTGGTDLSTSGQNNFNVLPCTNTGGYLSVGLYVLTPYSSGWTTGPTYETGDPVCLGWAPQGEMVAFAANDVPGYQVNAAQLNYPNVIDFAGTFTGPMDSMSAVYTWIDSGVVAQTVDLQYSTEFQDGTPWWFIRGNQWGAINLPVAAAQQSVTLMINGSALATYTNYNAMG